MSRPRHSLPEARVTPEALFLGRRKFLKGLGLGLGAYSLSSGLLRAADAEAPGKPPYAPKPNPAFPALADRRLTPANIAGSYNNFYEFTTDKSRVGRLAAGFPTNPWTIRVGGLVEKPFEIGIEDLMAKFPAEERIYRMRCVEGWSMVVPWDGFPFAKFVDYCKPLSGAKHLRFLSFNDPAHAPGQRDNSFPWPYYEGLRIDEARNDLTLGVTGVYGKPLPMQHGAPFRLVVPWKYGYKSPKSIVSIEFIAQQPPTFWNDLAPDEYSYLSNVDPRVPHPRWSQETERDIGNGDERIPTLPYNGYAAQVAALYKS
ncbi:sulfoxide reductase catalytic subunit YedY [Verrucomicrobium sp. GAS474]|uniref:protein-methionine-sulfoxide reductase catalytic subunit MsrP n=1 Tax=Verrucomicrobium sp. GAS474 TaxID=1882831 RepID=UPI00087DD9EF|nr:protein-methionine-sulfoxide reductase catalytic subunit MsrP [Verrucomicrobium sp. GAS474]SDU28203.1 sulfoxide reductase catalytic subunit YedY [Verrucomicrobium sp. GAS474]